MKKVNFLYVILALLLLAILLNYKLIFNKDKELFDGTLLHANGEYPEWKIDFLLWSGADPLFKYKEDATAIDSALWFKNFELVDKLSKNVSRKDKITVFFNNSTCGKLEAKDKCLNALGITEADTK